jgi:hypothetical protein
MIRDQQERDNLQRSIASAETALPVSAPSTRRILENLIEGARGRIATLDTKIKDEREAQVREQAAIALMAQKEAALSAREQAEYSGFLKEDFFTKGDFGRLEHFYAHAWDRLSEEGKDEMSHRFWEGIRHGEYKFSDAPKAVRDKEEDRVYAKLTTPQIEQDRIRQIPESDRADFIRAYKAGDREEAGRVLNRESFGKNVGLGKSAGIKPEASDEGKQVADQAVVENVKKPAAKDADTVAASAASAKFQDIQLDTVGLKGVALVNATSPPSAASLPDASGSRGNLRG